jgi:hypothetical protein
MKEIFSTLRVLCSALFSPVEVDGRFGGTKCLNLHGLGIRQASQATSGGKEGSVCA